MNNKTLKNIIKDYQSRTMTSYASFTENCSSDNSNCDINKCKENPINVLNMATNDHVTPNIRGPEIFDGSESKVEEFLKSFGRYAKIMGFSEERRVLLVTAFMTPEAINKYENAQGDTWETKMRSAFTREKNILEIMRELVEIKVGSNDPSTVFRKIDELVGKLVEKKLGKKEISDLAYANAVDDREVKREIALRGISKAEDIECIQKKIYEFESKSKDIRVDAYTTKRDNEWRTVEHKRRQPRPQNEERIIEERKRYFKTRKIYCRACHEEGHVRRECPNIRCNHCNKKGHVRTQCYENPNRFREREQWKRDNGKTGRDDRRNYSNVKYGERSSKTNRKYSVAELGERNEEWDRMSERTDRREDVTRRDYFTNNRKFRDEQGNEDARSQGEVISVLQ